MAQNKKKQPKKTIQLLSIESVQDLLDRGKIPMALEAVKSLYKLDPSPAVEDLMAKVYHARIQQLIDSSLVGEANQLISVASQKCPRHRVLFQSAQDQAVHFPLTQEDVDSLVQKLDDPILAQQDRDTVEALFIKGLSDPRLFIQSKQIPPNHPMRQQALWIWEALQALGPNGTEEDRQTRLARLAQVPRRSFLASWCFFIRALQALYEKDIPRASQMLSRIPPESSLTDAKKVLEAKCDGIGHPQGLSSKATRDLWRAMNSHSLHEKIQGLRTLLHQEKFTAFTQKFDEILTSPPFQDPYSSRLLIQDMIRGEETELHPVKLIQLFMPYYTKWFSERGSVFFMLDYFRSNMLGPDILEESYLQLISNIHSEHKSSLSPEEMGEIYWEFSRNLEKALQMEQDMFLNQEDRVFQQYLLDFLQKTCKFVSYPECYAALFRVSRQLKRPKKEIDKILHDWRAANPTDCQPLLILLEEAKQRGAMVKAMKYLEKAEQIDRINQNVRQARFQLIWKQLHKHLNQQKFHLAQKDLSSVQGLEMPPLRKAIFDGAAAYLAYIQNQEFQLPSSQDPFFFTLLFWHMHMSLPTKTTKEFEKDFPTPLLDRDSHLQSYFLIQDALRMLEDSLTLPAAWYKTVSKSILSIPNLSESLLLQVLDNDTLPKTPDLITDLTQQGIAQNGPLLQHFLFHRALLLYNSPHLQDDPIDLMKAALYLNIKRGNTEDERKCRQFLIDLLDDDPFSHEDNVFDLDSLHINEQTILKIIQHETDPKRNTQIKHSFKEKKIRPLPGPPDTPLKALGKILKQFFKEHEKNQKKERKEQREQREKTNPSPKAKEKKSTEILPPPFWDDFDTE